LPTVVLSFIKFWRFETVTLLVYWHGEKHIARVRRCGRDNPKYKSSVVLEFAPVFVGANHLLGRQRIA
jgi:hypothetical protein